MYAQTRKYYPDSMVKDFAELFVAGISPHPEDRLTAQMIRQKAVQWCRTFGMNIW
jgi:hypothetical protein